MRVGDLVQIHSHYKLEGSIAVVTEVIPPTSGVRTRYRVKTPCDHTKLFYNHELRRVSWK